MKNSPDAARKDWDAARDLLDANDFAGALVEYQRAYDESKNPRVLYNVAVCQKNLRHYARAEMRFKQELAEGTGKISPQDETDLKAAITALDPFVSTVEITRERSGGDAHSSTGTRRGRRRSTSRSRSTSDRTSSGCTRTASSRRCRP